MKRTKSEVASIFVDAQKGFTPICPDELPVEGGHEIVPHLLFMAMLAAFHAASRDAHSRTAPWMVASHDQMLQPTGLKHADLTWVPHCVVGTLGFELLDGLPRPLEYDYMVNKGIDPDLHPYGACYHDLDNQNTTGLIEVLRINGIKRVLVGGLATDYCVKTTVLQLLAAGFEVVVYLPACRAIAEATEIAALAEMINAGAVLARNEPELEELAYN
jgi:nicotinamidase/pyrazinamidase